MSSPLKLPPAIAVEIGIAEQKLTKSDPVMARLIAEFNPCTLLRSPLNFEYAVYTIIGQQISTKAAASIRDRLKTLCGRMTPGRILALEPAAIKSAGLSLRKVETIRILAEMVARREIRFSEFPRMSDEEIIAAMTRVKGIGRWTAEMLLIFTMGRLDVFPINDGAIVAMMSALYGVDRSDKAGLTAIADKWGPYRSVACWYLYRYKNSRT